MLSRVTVDIVTLGLRVWNADDMMRSSWVKLTSLGHLLIRFQNPCWREESRASFSSACLEGDKLLRSSGELGSWF